MPVYSDLWNKGNTSGVHYFDAALLSDPLIMTGLEEAPSPTLTSVEGPVIQLRTVAKTVVLDKIVVGLNGQKTRNNATDTLILTTATLHGLPASTQDQLATWEEIPGGRRLGTKPRRGV